MAESIDVQVILRVMKDPEFRRSLVANPQETLEKEFQLKLPAGVTIQVHEESDTVRHMVIPKAQTGGVDLPDEDLARAAGGLPGGGWIPPGGLRPPVGVPLGGGLPLPRGGPVPFGGLIAKCCTCGASTSQTLSTLQSCR